MNTKAKGTRRERQTIKLLEENTYHCTRSAGSLGAFDIIAMSAKRDIILNVQVKSNGWPPKKEMDILTAFELPSNIYILVVRWDDSKGGRGNEVVPQMKLRLHNGEWLDLEQGQVP